jgi:RNA polymerase sigma factor (sigma-70 family)
LKKQIVAELHPIVYELAPSVAHTITRRYKGFVEQNDVVQECVTWAVTRNPWITQEMSEEDPEKRKHNESRIAWQMRRAAERYARKEKAVKSGYQPNDEAYYESPTIGQLLPFVIASVVDGTVLEQVQQMVQDGQPKGKSSPAEGGNLLAVLIDIKRSYLKLDEYDRNLLRLRYFDSLTLEKIANSMQCAVSTADRRVNTSMRRLIDQLGGQSPWR